jgi:quercetin dioxygenase-like cupin family protein
MPFALKHLGAGAIPNAFGRPCALVKTRSTTNPHIQKELPTMKRILLTIFLACSPLLAQEAKVSSLVLKPLPDIPGKDVQVLTVTYPPGSHDPVHRHYADAFVYVLEGSIVMAVNGDKPVTLTQGQTFYEGPNDIHTIGRNASDTVPAKFVVFLLKNRNAPVLVPVK